LLQRWASSTRWRLTANLDVPVDSHQAIAEVAAAYGLREDLASLVRPDGFVASRSQSGMRDPLATLATAVDTALARTLSAGEPCRLGLTVTA
jgi:hypothetical protein